MLAGLPYCIAGLTCKADVPSLSNVQIVEGNHMVKKYLSSIFVTPVNHFVPVQTGASSQVWRDVEKLLDATGGQSANAVSIQTYQSARWEPASATRLRIVDKWLTLSLMGYFCFGIASVLGIF